MTTIDLAEIKRRIEDNQLEMAALSQRYDTMVAEFNQHTQEHNANLQRHQQRYQQCVGAAALLEQLKQLLTTPDNGAGLKVVNRLAKK